MTYVTKLMALSIVSLGKLAQATLGVIEDIPTVICDDDAECDYHCCNVDE